MKPFITILLLLLGALLICLLIAIIRTLLLPKKQTSYALSEDKERVDTYSEKLSRMVQIETISDRNDPSIEKFLTFHKLLEELFPTVFATCEKVEIDGNLLLKWKGDGCVGLTNRGNDTNILWVTENNFKGNFDLGT